MANTELQPSLQRLDFASLLRLKGFQHHPRPRSPWCPSRGLHLCCQQGSSILSFLASEPEP